MKCDKCGEKFNVALGKSINFCSNCGNKLTAEKKIIQSFDTAIGVLAHIADEYGAEVLLGSKIHSVFADLTRNQLVAERKLIKILADEGALDCLKDAIGKRETEQAIAVKRAVARLPFAKAEGEEMLLNFASALGWQLPKPQTDVAQHPIAQKSQAVQPNTVQQQTKHTIVLPNINTSNETLIAKPRIGSIQKFVGIDWRVLDVQGNKVLLISEKILEKRPYNAARVSIKWESCTLRKYLNSEFYNSLGSAKSAIADTLNQNPNNPWYGTAGGNVTTDKVFLLSLDEVCRYFGDSITNLKKKGDVFLSDGNNSARIANYVSGGASWWWLRSPGLINTFTACVNSVGNVGVNGFGVNGNFGGVRPALWLNLQPAIH